ncbi:peptide ABC transporter substrate-binding protein [Clostridium guangxiense]|uniref:peptide ABC transporter substrate-binding protein n=1 Tax=Clostridium guangxiense TaxID=1662055 RepID=UPI001E33282C|nr:peptide ABC transporter substrate-binding protein [Clostridium guangxiense]MCD2347629.1 peptide ABC transporter substrate-binding protein [Clostridium guangxiense]
MLKGRKSKIVALITSTLVIGSLLSGCGSQSTTKNTQQAITYNLGANPKTIDPGLNSSVEGGIVIANAFEGLTEVDANNQPHPGIAKSWDESDGGKHYVFHLRKNAKWSDGKVVTAKDFEYAWKRALAPETASDYAYQLYYLKNGEAYNGNKVSADQVGVKATDDYTLDVQLENPTPYFLSLLAFQTYMPLRQDIVSKNANGWALKASTYVSDGAFKLQTWKQNSKLEFVKNPYYWNKSVVKLDKLTYTVLNDATSYMSAFESGQVDIIDTPPAEQTPTLLKQGKAKTYPNIGTYYYGFNLDPKAKLDPAVAKAMDNVNVRKAISLAIDRNSLVKNVVKGGQIPSTSFVPSGMVGSDGKDFKQKEYFQAKGDVSQAKQLLSQAGYPDGKGFPTIELMYNSDGNNPDIAQAIQAMLKKNLNINVTLRAVERKIQLDETTKRTYAGISRNGWSADYADPMTFLDMWVTSSGNNVTGYSNPAYDKLIAKAKAETDTTKRFDEMHQAEDILMNDMPVVPLYEYNVVSCIKSYVKGTYRTPMDVLYFTKAYVQK